MRLKKISAWTAVVIIMATIFGFSSQPATESNKVSKGVTRAVVDTLPYTKDLPDEDKENIVTDLNSFVRDNAHFFLYMLMGAFLLLAMKLTFSDKSTLFIFVATATICLVFSISDEIHQIFVPGRGCQLKDVAIDFLGSVTSITIILLKKIFSKGLLLIRSFF